MTPEEETVMREIEDNMVMVRHLSRQITTREQFDQIVGGIVDPALQGQIRKLLIPLLRFKVE